ncbi:flagellar hook capping protein [Paenibacillus rhizovicinus]|uniref:Flagellar hook capping protein n=1 Tax=Paenibacillus rhizovicinus TaxID=2704463 RepID=A0A6C0NV34_9BACL|nr:flagellar hook capping FlgD N-terminal domain-containing protein [Paenibacillus rhizovicinus]QHW30064.1 flagellar hook capping protein [Paenibacillus rhizovicinus]
MADRVSTSNVWPNYSASNVQTATNKPADTSMGKDDFLKILVTQLQNQDPMQPMEDKDFIAQMAQFTSVEQLTNMADQLAALRQNLGMASTMIGKTVQWYDYSDTGEMQQQSGIVDAITIRDKVQYAQVGSQEISLDDIVSIADQGGETANG